MGKGDKKISPKPQPYVSKRQMTRFEREKRLTRITLGACAAFVVIIFAVLGVGVWRELHRGEDPVATVAGHVISAETYAKVIGLQTTELELQQNYYQSYLNSLDRTDTNNQYLVQMLTNQLSSISDQKGSLEETALRNLINNELFKNEATQRGISVTQDEIDQTIYSQFGETEATNTTEAAATPDAETTVGTSTAAPAAGDTSPTATAKPSVTPTTIGTSTPYPTPTPPNKTDVDKAKQNLKNTLDDIGGFMTEQDYIKLVVEPELLAAKVQEAICKEVTTTAEQVDVAHILVAQEQEANDILTQLKNGADFATLAKEKSTDTSNKDAGGDLGWFTRGSMVSEFDDAAFKTKPGELYPEVVKTDFGYHIIKGIGYDANRPLSDTQIQTAQQQAVNNWLKQQQAVPNQVVYNYGWDQMSWARSYVANSQKEAAKKAASATKTPIPAATTTTATPNN